MDSDQLVDNAVGISRFLYWVTRLFPAELGPVSLHGFMCQCACHHFLSEMVFGVSSRCGS